MNSKFREAVEALHPKLTLLIGSVPHSAGVPLPMKGVYLFCEEGKPLYVGRSNNIPQRRKNHTSLSAGANQAAFAVLLVREQLRLVADYRPGPGTRARLSDNAEFAEAFRKAKERVRAMQFRAVEERDQTRQALLEIYCAVALETPYNDFRTH